MKAHRLATLVLVLVLGGALAAGLGTAGGRKAPAGKPLLIGAALGFTGFLKPYEGEAFVTAQLAADDINAAGGLLGRPVAFVKADTRSDTNLAPTAAAGALAKGAEILLTSDLTFGGPAARLAQQKGILAMSVFASPPEFGPAGIGPLAFSGGIMTPDEAAVAAEFAYGKKRWRTAYELEDASIDYTRSFHQYFRQTWKRLGGTFVGRDTFQNADPSIATQITRIRSLAKQPDFILMTSYNPGGASAVRQIRAAGIDTPILSGQPMDGTYWVNAVPNLRNFYVSTYASFMGDDANPFVNTLRERFRKKTGRYPTLGYFVTGYNVVDLLAKAIAKAGTTDGKALARTLETFKDVQTRPLGKTCFSKRWHVSLCRPFAVVEFRDGKPRFLGRFVPRYVPRPRLSGK